ncbi:MAG: simple sugar transport system ATP-binding protein [Candidatus Atribacteria bacterium]|nr:simple sugar transport system ATP-binding protein [Candidatus Atribacteria bacterium]
MPAISQETQTKPYLALHQVSKKYGGVVALKGVDFTILPGEIHGLVGENGSGKSTLVKIITGVVRPEKGARIEINGQKVEISNPFAAFCLGIQVVHQDLSLFPNLSVAENIVYHRYLEKSQRVVNWRAIEAEATQIMDKLGVELSPQVEVSHLPVADQQLVAICRAIASEARLIILDEPTSSLTRREVNRLFSFLKELKAQGISVLFISHRLDEVLEISDRITVFRDGQKVGTFNQEEVDKNRLSFLMTGKEISFHPVKGTTSESKTEVLKLENLTKKGQYEKVSFSVYRGEILGLIGPRGAGRSEVALTIFGLNPADEGKIYFEGKSVVIDSAQRAIQLGIGYVPENRLLQGLVLEHSVENNLVITVLDQIIGKAGLTDQQKKRNLSQKAVRDFNIKTETVEVPVKTLSGGNQQKVVLAKWMLTSPHLLLLDNPTHGVDVAAKESIYQSIKELSQRGLSFIFISDEEIEVLNNCDRILVMKNGQIIGEFSPAEVSEEELRKMILE